MDGGAEGRGRSVVAIPLLLSFTPAWAESAWMKYRLSSLFYFMDVQLAGPQLLTQLVYHGVVARTLRTPLEWLGVLYSATVCSAALVFSHMSPERYYKHRNAYNAFFRVMFDFLSSFGLVRWVPNAEVTELGSFLRTFGISSGIMMMLWNSFTYPTIFRIHVALHTLGFLGYLVVAGPLSCGSLLRNTAGKAYIRGAWQLVRHISSRAEQLGLASVLGVLDSLAGCSLSASAPGQGVTVGILSNSTLHSISDMAATGKLGADAAESNTAAGLGEVGVGITGVGCDNSLPAQCLASISFFQLLLGYLLPTLTLYVMELSSRSYWLMANWQGQAQPAVPATATPDLGQAPAGQAQVQEGQAQGQEGQAQGQEGQAWAPHEPAARAQGQMASWGTESEAEIEPELLSMLPQQDQDQRRLEVQRWLQQQDQQQDQQQGGISTADDEWAPRRSAGPLPTRAVTTATASEVVYTRPSGRGNTWGDVGGARRDGLLDGGAADEHDRARAPGVATGERPTSLTRRARGAGGADASGAGGAAVRRAAGAGGALQAPAASTQPLTEPVRAPRGGGLMQAAVGLGVVVSLVFVFFLAWEIVLLAIQQGYIIVLEHSK